MTEATLDSGVSARAIALEAAVWFYDRTSGEPETIADLINLAEIIEHFLTQGASVEFYCSDGLRKTVLGQ